MTRREQALEKIRRLESRLEVTKTQHAVEKIEWEICRLQSIYSITIEEIEGPKDYAKMFPFLSESELKALGWWNESITS